MTSATGVGVAGHVTGVEACDAVGAGNTEGVHGVCRDWF